ncbi:MULTISPECIES: hypothetical protein [unclassified Streptomyces]|uniref:hypothetical protein n=1 Tax=unclassified Streptomyces TaxID=2593676 RepID=UPI000DAB726B|nr:MULTISPECIES: hypothetical protein [unclassified Streptomyces]PZT77708.1 hypothetical protein DNK56_31665 [Streptomyces sp. AC1-42W]PZT78340.1 hypothetical protein DNK55_01020 [Streptomyces sp. AC1-42T]
MRDEPAAERLPAAHASAAWRCLVALLLAMLALGGGAPAVAGAGLPVRAVASLAGTHTAPAPALPPRGTPAARTAGAMTTVPGLPAHSLSGTRSGASTPAAAAPPTLIDGGPRPGPWAAAEHPRTAHQLPPPGAGGLVPSPAGVPLPLPVPSSARPVPAAAAPNPRPALPGVRGPPGTGVHRSGDRPAVPLTHHAVPFPPS